MMMNVLYRGENCRVEITRYYQPENIAIVLYSPDGSPMAKASVNLDYPLKDGYVAIKDYSENAGMLKALVSAGIVEDTGETHIVGYAMANICKLLKTE